LVGESGCGKSQLALALAGLSSKQALINFEAPILPRRTAMIFQDPLTSLNPVMKIGKQILEGIKSKEVGRSKKDKVIALLEKVGIDNPEKRYHQYPHEFSGGMQQRVLIAIALAQEPDLLIADEPTTALDVTIQAQILDLLRELHQSSSLSILFITHDLVLLREFAHKIIVMYAAKIIESGRVENIFSNPKHPYTQALMSVSLLNKTSDGNFESIPGTVPSPQDYPSGCRFHPRCKFGIDSCSETIPEFETNHTHAWACPVV
jgi:peptide/nickel transport system ATP-binding protein/oligopeptide transport system ATP-binding protein